MPRTNHLTLHPQPSLAALSYNPALSLWLSVDPLSDKYPNLSPYTYCANNPVKLKDPDGREIGDYFNLNGDYLGTDGLDDGKIHVVSDTHWNEIKNTGYVADDGTTIISSAFATADGFSNWFQKPSEANLSGDAVFNIVKHYNSTGIPNEKGRGPFALRTFFTMKDPSSILINTTKWKNSNYINNSYEIRSSYDHEAGHIKQFYEMGYDKMLNGQSKYAAEEYAINYQKSQTNWERTSPQFKNSTENYLKSFIVK